ncbi:MAG: putative decarboxylase [Hyphomicrobiales bacterium]|nr:putative decarboxylase [Hyphomicrobiales bacterium]
MSGGGAIMHAPAASPDKGEQAMDQAEAPLQGAAIIAAIKKAGVDYVLSVPDLHTSTGLLKPIAHDPDLKLIRVCKEDETLGIAAGLSYGDRRALILIQYTGFLYAMNAIRAMACEQSMPMCLMIGLLGKEPEKASRDSGRFGVRIIEPLLDVMGIAFHRIAQDADAGLIAPAIEAAYMQSKPVAFLIERRPVHA